jgi:uncharacterized protein YdhG (YjbR/CyaY superfamily)
MAAAATVDEYIAGFPPEVAERLQGIREVIVANVPDADEKVRYGIAAVMLGGRYAIHYAGWKKHIGLYPVPTLDEPLESRVAPYRAEKDSVVFPHSGPIPYELIADVTRAIVAGRAGAQSGSD